MKTLEIKTISNKVGKYPQKDKTGATKEDVALMFKAVDGKASVKASGGIRDAKTFEEMIKAGATRIGCSAGVKIMEDSNE